MKYFVLVSAFFISFVAAAAPRVNSGGGGWACRKTDGSGQVLWIKAADLTKVEFYQNVDFKEKTGNRWELLAEQHKKIKDVLPALNALLESHPFDIANKLVAMPEALNFVPDAELRYKPPMSSCEGVVSYVQLADTTMDDKLVYSSRVWNDPTFSEFHKAAILLHEEIYFALRKSFGDESSYRTRQIMGILYSNYNDATLRDTVAKVLKAKPRLSPGIFGFENGPALFNVQVQCSLLINESIATKITWTPNELGGESSRSQDGYRFVLKTSAVDGSPLMMEIKDQNTGMSVFLDERETIATFNSLRRVSLNLKVSSSRSVTFRCDSSSPLDGDPL